ncbi:MAG: hypothetical protein AAFX99_01990 [Myxococcota bacterium]
MTPHYSLPLPPSTPDSARRLAMEQLLRQLDRVKTKLLARRAALQRHCDALGKMHSATQDARLRMNIIHVVQRHCSEINFLDEILNG